MMWINQYITLHDKKRRYIRSAIFNCDLKPYERFKKIL